jgi:hypothetical protein
MVELSFVPKERLEPVREERRRSWERLLCASSGCSSSFFVIWEKNELLRARIREFKTSREAPECATRRGHAQL